MRGQYNEIGDLLSPTCVKDVQHFLGMVQYLRFQIIDTNSLKCLGKIVIYSLSIFFLRFN